MGAVFLEKVFEKDLDKLKEQFLRKKINKYHEFHEIYSKGIENKENTKKIPKPKEKSSFFNKTKEEDTINKKKISLSKENNSFFDELDSGFVIKEGIKEKKLAKEFSIFCEMKVYKKV